MLCVACRRQALYVCVIRSSAAHAQSHFYNITMLSLTPIKLNPLTMMRSNKCVRQTHLLYKPSTGYSSLNNNNKKQPKTMYRVFFLFFRCFVFALVVVVVVAIMRVLVAGSVLFLHFLIMIDEVKWKFHIYIEIHGSSMRNNS